MNTFDELQWNKQHHIVDQLFLYTCAELYGHQMLNYDATELIVWACKNYFWRQFMQSKLHVKTK